MTAHHFPLQVPQPRNLAIFWGATLDGRKQSELAAEYGVTQQRVSQIVRATRRFVALATSEQYDGLPQRAQLQLACRIQLERLKRRRREVSAAWRASTGPKTSVKRVQGPQGERVETVQQSQHGDWRLDRQLGQIDQAIVDTTLLLYERPWVGGERKAEGGKREAEELRIGDCGLRIGEEEAVRSQGPNEGLVEGACAEGQEGPELVVAGVVEVGDPLVGKEGSAVVLDSASVLGTPFPVLSTEPEPDPTGADVPEALVAPPTPVAPANAQPLVARRLPPPGSAIRNPYCALRRRHPICDLTGRWIGAPTDAHRPWRQVRMPRAWLANPTASGYTPAGVLWKLRPPVPEVRMVESREACGSSEADLAGDESGAFEQDALESSEVLVEV